MADMADRFGATMTEHYLFADDGNVPNNPRLPLIVYRGALKTNGDAAASYSTALVGQRPGRMEFIRVITITVAPRRCSASTPVAAV